MNRSRVGRRRGALLALLLGAGACGDVTGDLITDPSSPMTPAEGGNMAGGDNGGSEAGGNEGGGSDIGDNESGGSETGDNEGGGPDTGGSTAETGGSSGSVGARACETNLDCTQGDRRVCDPALLRCVECLDDVFCSEEEEECSSVLAACAQPCVSPEDCDGDEPICDLRIGDTATTGFCVECRENADCDGGRGICRDFECGD